MPNFQKLFVECGILYDNIMRKSNKLLLKYYLRLVCYLNNLTESYNLADDDHRHRIICTFCL